MLGWEWERRLKDLGISGVALGRDELDVTDEISIERAFAKYRPSVVVHCAAYTNVDKAETEREAARLGNAVSPALVAKACLKHNALMVHYGTDQVFDGSGSVPRTENDEPNPLNHYAATKLAGEGPVLNLPGSLVIRVQWLYGEKKDRFTPLKDKEVFTPFSDQIGAPTWTRDIVEISLSLLARRASGLFHLAYDDSASWAEVFERVKRTLGYRVSLQPKLTREFNLPAARPLYSVLSNRKLCAALGVPSLGSWKDSLDEFLKAVGAK